MSIDDLIMLALIILGTVASLAGWIAVAVCVWVLLGGVVYLNLMTGSSEDEQ